MSASFVGRETVRSGSLRWRIGGVVVAGCCRLDSDRCLRVGNRPRPSTARSWTERSRFAEGTRSAAGDAGEVADMLVAEEDERR